MNSGIIADIKLRAQKKTIHELRQIARAVGVARPADGKKERLIEDIVKIATCEIPPAPRNSRGAPPKSSFYDESLVADIEECINYFSALKNAGGQDNTDSVSDGTFQSECSGILSRKASGYVLQTGCLGSSADVAVHESFVLRFNLKEGDFIEGHKAGSDSSATALISLTSVNGERPENLKRTPFESLNAVYPRKRIQIYSGAEDYEARATDLFAPVGRGQRGVITGGCNNAVLALIKQIATAICLNEPDLKVVIHLMAERPEDVNLFKSRECGAEIFYTLFSEGNSDVVKGAEFVLNYCKRQVECGKSVVLLADGLSRLERASAALGAKGAAKRFLSAAVCGGEVSLTVLAAISSEDGELERELRETSNMQVDFPLDYALQGVVPAINAIKTYTAGAETLQARKELFAASALRKRLFQGEAEPEDIAGIFKKTASNGQIIRELTDG